jgi:peptide/nickel transport system substrate-binding protein
MGAGPYKFVRYENKVVYMEANPLYWRGEPKIKHLQWRETNEPDKVTAITTGTADWSEPSNSKAKLAEISGYNSNGEASGDVITYKAVENLGYGYIGIQPRRVLVGNDPASQASRNLRKALGTILSVYRDLTIDSYYGATASTIEYPITSVSWASPRPTDPGYTPAYSRDAAGKPIYTSGMDAQTRYAAAEQAALGYLEAAGYTITNGKATAAPEGASLSYTIMIAGAGQGDHPSFALVTNARNSLANIGITLNIQDLADSSVLFTSMDAGSVDIWVAAWGATIDPDLYQTYYSGNSIGNGTGSNLYNIEDTQLDEYIIAARTSLDNTFRKQVLQEAFNIIMDWAVEIPVYQRQNAQIFSTKRVNISTLTDISTFYGVETYKLELAK